MKEIQLTKGKVAIVDDEDFERLSSLKWCMGSKYAVHGVYDGQKVRHIFMHRLIMGNPEGKQVDHINLDKLDNRKENLRICTRSQNGANKKAQKNNKCGYKGVSLNKGKYYRAQIKINKKVIHLGMFKTAEEAAEMYKAAAKAFHGDFFRAE
jgi:hypothetical protein